MGNEHKVISYQEFLTHTAKVYEQALHGEKFVIQRGEGESVVLNVAESVDEEELSPEKLTAFLSAAGGWADMDTETLKSQLRDSREMPPRPPVDL